MVSSPLSRLIFPMNRKLMSLFQSLLFLFFFLNFLLSLQRFLLTLRFQTLFFFFPLQYSLAEEFFLFNCLQDFQCLGNFLIQ